MFPDLIRTASRVERVLVEYIFIRRLLPLEMFRVEIVNGLDHCDTDYDRRKRFAIGDVDLDTAACLPGPLLKCRLEKAGAKCDAFKPEFIKLRGPDVRIYERRAGQLQSLCE